MFKFSRVEGDSLVKYDFFSYEDAKSWVEKECEKFKKINRVRDESKDRYFLDFKSGLEKSLQGQKENMDDYLKCGKCKEEDHEGQFCRCEDRNIRIAIERRKRKENSWCYVLPH